MLDPSAGYFKAAIYRFSYIASIYFYNYMYTWISVNLHASNIPAVTYNIAIIVTVNITT